jgi:hypothetical protein
MLLLFPEFAKRLIIQLVPRASAVPDGTAEADTISIHADHLNMIKFASKEDNGYRTVACHLQVLSKSAPEVVALKWVEEARIAAGM